MPSSFSEGMEVVYEDVNPAGIIWKTVCGRVSELWNKLSSQSWLQFLFEGNLILLFFFLQKGGELVCM